MPSDKCTNAAFPITRGGTISDEDMHAISGGKKRQKTGQDHSLENYEDSEPTSGVGAVQDYSDTSSDIAHIKESE